MKLVGRDSELKAIRAVDAGVVVVEGDSGIGKSAVLSALGDGWAEDTTAVPGARMLGASAGSFQIAFMDELAESLGDHLSTYPKVARKAWKAIGAALERATNAGAREVGQLIVGSIHSTVERHFGKEVADVGRSVLGSALQPASGGLEGRLRDLSSSDFATQVLAVADELATLTKKRQVLRFDQGEVLNDADLALLADLAERAIPSLVVILGYSTASLGAAATLAKLESRGAIRQRLSALSDLEMSEWLTQESVERAKWPEISRATSGYPFFLQDAIRLIREGGSLNQLKAPNGFESLLSLSWQALPLQLRPRAMALAAFTEPPADEYLLRLLELSQLEWSTVRRELTDANVFVRRPDGSTWFHDRRRDYIWRVLMGDADRAAASDTAISALRDWQTSRDRIEAWAIESLPDLLASAGREVASGNKLATIAGLKYDELAVLFAIIELVEATGEMQQFADTSAVVDYASARFGAPEDPVATLERLKALALIVWSSNEHASVVGLLSTETLSYPSLLGQISKIIGQMPFPGFASTMFHSVVRPIVGTFKVAQISLGPGTLRTHRGALASLAKHEAQVERRIRAIPALGVVAEVEGQPFVSTLTFESEADRASAHDRLREYEQSREAHQPIITSVHELPPGPVRSARYKAIAERAGVKDEHVPVSKPKTLQAWVEQRVAVAEVVRRHLTDDEASSFGLVTPRSVLLHVGTDGSSLELDVAGSPIAEVRPLPSTAESPSMDDPLLSLKLKRDGQLKHGERIVFSSMHYGQRSERAHPLVEVAERMEKWGREFNRSLDSFEIPLDADQISDLIAREQGLWSDIARDLNESAGMKIDLNRFRRSRHIILRWSDWGGTKTWSAETLTIDDGRAGVFVRFEEAAEAEKDWPRGAELPRRFGLKNDAEVVSSGRGFADSIIARLLGFDDFGARFEWRGLPSSETQSG